MRLPWLRAVGHLLWNSQRSKDLVLTGLTQVVIAVTSLGTIKLLGQRIGPGGLGRYMLVWRTLALLEPVLLLGQYIGVTRYIAIAGNSPTRRGLYQKVGLGVPLALSILLVVLMNLFPRWSAQIFWGRASETSLILPLSALCIAAPIWETTYAYYRGRLFMGRANLLQLFNAGLWPILLLLIAPFMPVERLLLWTGLLSIGLSILLSPPILSDITADGSLANAGSAAREMISYGILRVPGELGMAGLMSLGPLIMSRMGSIEDVGYLSLGLMILKIASTGLLPLSIILLPWLARDLSRNSVFGYKSGRGIAVVLIVVTHLIFWASTQALVLLDHLLSLWLGDAFTSVLPIAVVFLLVCNVYAVFLVLRPALDAATKYPINTVNTSFALACFVAALGLVRLITLVGYRMDWLLAITASIALSIVVLGILSYRTATRFFGQLLGISDLGITVLLGSGAAIITLTIKTWLVSTSLVVLAFYEALLLAGFLVLRLWIFALHYPCTHSIKRTSEHRAGRR